MADLKTFKFDTYKLQKSNTGSKLHMHNTKKTN